MTKSDPLVTAYRDALTAYEVAYRRLLEAASALRKAASQK